MLRSLVGARATSRTSTQLPVAPLAEVLFRAGAGRPACPSAVKHGGEARRRRSTS